MDPYKLIEQDIQERADKRGLHGTISHIRYFNRCLNQFIKKGKHKKALFVGVGHGHNAAICLLDGLVEYVIGVDPYIADDGNNSEDHKKLLTIIDSCNLRERFKVEKKTIQSYLEDVSEDFDLIICSDVLHHIFVTEEHLSKSDLSSQAIHLFKRFSDISRDNGMLVISEVQRYGIRPFLKNAGFIKKNMDYRTKQPWVEWKKAAVEADWDFVNIRNYVPYRFREKRKVFEGILGRYTLCDKYFLYYSKKSK